MNTVSRKNLIFEILIFFVLVFSAFFLFNFVSKKISVELKKIEQIVYEKIENEIGVCISYESLSPSILLGLSISNINIEDMENQQKLAYFKKVYIKYNLIHLIVSNYSEAIRSINIEYGNVFFDSEKNARLLSKFVSLSKSSNNKSIEMIDKTLSQQKLDIAGIEVFLKNISLLYSTPSYSSKMVISHGRAYPEINNIAYEIQSNFSYYRNDHGQGNTERIKFFTNISGNIASDLSFISSVISVDNLLLFNVKSKPLTFFLSYRDNVFSGLALQKQQAVDFQFSFNTLKKDGSISLQFNNFAFKDLFYPVENDSYINFKDVFATSLLGNAKLRFGFSEKNHLDWSWSMDMKANNPKLDLYDLSLKGSHMVFNGSGSKNAINVNYFNFISNRLKFSSGGLYNFDTNYVNAFFNIDNFQMYKEKSSAKFQFYSEGKSTKCRVTDVKLGKAKFSNLLAVLTPNTNGVYFNLHLTDATGRMQVKGDYSYKTSGKINLHAIIDSISLSNIYYSISSFTHEGSDPIRSAGLEPFRLTTEIHAGGTKNNFFYKIPQFILASINKNGPYTIASFNGSNTSFNAENIRMRINDVDVDGKVHAGFENLNDVFFETVFSVNSVIYSANGMYSNDTLTVYGDYGLALTAYLNDNNIQGSFNISEIPVPILPFVLSMDLNFNWKGKDNWNIVCNNTNLVYNNLLLKDGKSSFALNFKANADQNSWFLYDLTLGNEGSFLQGEAVFNKISSSYDYIRQFASVVNLYSPDKDEGIHFTSNFSVSDKIYIDGKCNFNNISLQRFSNTQSKEDKVNANITFLGSIDNLLLQANLDNLSMHLQDKPLTASGIFLLDDGLLKVPDANILWGNHNLKSIVLNFIPDMGKGNLNFDYDGSISGKKTVANVNIDMVGQRHKNIKNTNAIAKFQNFLQAFVLNLSIENWRFGESDKKRPPLMASLIRESDIMAFYSGSHDEIYGFFKDDGHLHVQIDERLKTHLSLDGHILPNKLDLYCYNMNLDVPQILNLLPIEQFVSFKQGNISGELEIKGLPSEPEFIGEFKLNNGIFNSPGYAPQYMNANNVPIYFNGNFLEVPYTVFSSKKFSVWAECTSEFDGWIPSETIVKCGTVGDDRGHMKTKNLLFHTDGSVTCDLVMTIKPSAFDLQGWATFDNGCFSIPFNDFDKFTALFEESDMDFSMDLSVTTGNKTEFRWPNMELPILRAFVPTKEPIVFKVDGASDYFTITGLADIRGGELLYIKRNFYIKKGDIHFVRSVDGVEPFITLRSEIREQDINGDPVKLILSVIDQPLIGSSEDWISKISAEPPLADLEIKQLLGQAVTGDINRKTVLKDALTNATDMISQLGFAKKGENAIRDFLHLDVFSLRTQILQNAIFGNLLKTSDQGELKAGNYLDNTTLYIGKYLGSAIYLDGLVHLNYYDPLKDKNISRKKPVVGSVLFQPEIGLEMETPLFNIRWAVSPSDPSTLFVADSSITFSWRFDY